MKAFLPGAGVSFAKNPSETAADICADFLIPGFLQNRLIADLEYGPKFAEKSREVMRLASDFLVCTPQEAETRGNNSKVVVAMFEQNKLVTDFAALRLSQLVEKIMEEGIEKHIQNGVGEGEIPEDFKKLHEEFSESVDDKTTVHAARVFGPLGKMFEHFVGVAGGVEAFSRTQLEASEAMREKLLGVQPELALLLTLTGTIGVILQNRMIDQSRFVEAYKAFENTLIAARDMTTTVSLTADAPASAIIAMRLSALVSDVLKEAEEQGAAEPAEEVPAESNVVQFPTSKTVH